MFFFERVVEFSARKLAVSIAPSRLAPMSPSLVSATGEVYWRQELFVDRSAEK